MHLGAKVQQQKTIQEDKCMDDKVLHFFFCCRSKDIPIFSPTLQALLAAARSEGTHECKASDWWLAMFRGKHTIKHKSPSKKAAEIETRAAEERLRWPRCRLWTSSKIPLQCRWNCTLLHANSKEISFYESQQAQRWETCEGTFECFALLQARSWCFRWMSCNVPEDIQAAQDPALQFACPLVF